jgi:hypothetical protein
MPHPPPAAPRVPAVAKVFAAFLFVLAVIALLAFWPPTAVDEIAWLIVWMTLCVTTSVAILRHERFAAPLVWTVIVVASLSAALALRAGLLDAMGVVIDIVLFVPMICFAIWYQRSRRLER